MKLAKPAHAAFVVARLEAALRDVDEHGDDAEFADDAEFPKKELVKWKKKSKTSAQREHFDPRLASEVVAASDLEKLPAAWKKIRATKNLSNAVDVGAEEAAALLRRVRRRGHLQRTRGHRVAVEREVVPTSNSGRSE